MPLAFNITGFLPLCSTYPVAMPLISQNSAVFVSNEVPAMDAVAFSGQILVRDWFVFVLLPNARHMFRENRKCCNFGDAITGC